MTADEIKDVLDKHAKWLRAEDGGERAYLRGANLRGADLSGAYLRGANPSGATITAGQTDDLLAALGVKVVPATEWLEGAA